MRHREPGDSSVSVDYLLDRPRDGEVLAGSDVLRWCGQHRIQLGCTVSRSMRLVIELDYDLGVPSYLRDRTFTAATN